VRIIPLFTSCAIESEDYALGTETQSIIQDQKIVINADAVAFEACWSLVVT
jgi:hypothetical protein